MLKLLFDWGKCVYTWNTYKCVDHAFIYTWMYEFNVIVDNQVQNLKQLKNNLYADVHYRIFAFTNLLVDESLDPGVHFHAGLSDCKAIIGEAAELECKVSSEDCEGIWYKDGEEVIPRFKCAHYVAYASMLLQQG